MRRATVTMPPTRVGPTTRQAVVLPGQLRLRLAGGVGEQRGAVRRLVRLISWGLISDVYATSREACAVDVGAGGRQGSAAVASRGQDGAAGGGAFDARDGRQPGQDGLTELVDVVRFDD